MLDTSSSGRGTSRSVSGMAGDAEFARQIIDDGQYLVLATADPEGNPWPTPVWYAREGRRFVWVSWPDARHSNNIEARSTVGFVIFETPVPVRGRTRAVYAEATAAEVQEADRDHCIGIYDRRSRAQGLGAPGRPNASSHPPTCGSTRPSCHASSYFGLTATYVSRSHSTSSR